MRADEELECVCVRCGASGPANDVNWFYGSSQLPYRNLIRSPVNGFSARDADDDGDGAGATAGAGKRPAAKVQFAPRAKVVCPGCRARMQREYRDAQEERRFTCPL